MFNLDNITKKVLDVQVANLPIGKAVVLTTALGVAAGLANTVDSVTKGKIPPIATQAIVAGAMGNIPVIEKFLGKDMTQLISISALTSGINQQFGVSGRIVDLLNTVTSLIPGVDLTVPMTIASEPETETQQDSGLSGYSMGAYSAPEPQQLPNVDDIDLALLNARGYQTA